MKKNLAILLVLGTFTLNAFAIDFKSMAGRFSLDKGNSPGICIDQTLLIGSSSDKSVFIDGFAINWLSDVNDGWQLDGYGVNYVKATFDGTTLTKSIRGIEGVRSTTWAIDSNNQRLVMNQYSYGQLSNTCSFTRDL